MSPICGCVVNTRQPLSRLILRLPDDSSVTMAVPLELQRLEASLDMGPFMQHAHEILSHPLTSSEAEDSDTGSERHMDTLTNIGL